MTCFNMNYFAFSCVTYSSQRTMTSGQVRMPDQVLDWVVFSPLLSIIKFSSFSQVVLDQQNLQMQKALLPRYEFLQWKNAPSYLRATNYYHLHMIQCKIYLAREKFLLPRPLRKPISCFFFQLQKSSCKDKILW